MIEVGLEFLQLAALGWLGYLLRGLKVVKLQAPSLVPYPELPGNRAAQVLSKESGSWQQTALWVRESTQAWRDAIAQPGLALKYHDGTVEEGVQ